MESGALYGSGTIPRVQLMVCRVQHAVCCLKVSKADQEDADER